MLEKMLAYCTKAYTADMLIIIEIPGNKGNFHFLKKFRLRWFVNVVYMGTSGGRDMTFSFLRLRSLQSCQLMTSGRFTFFIGI